MSDGRLLRVASISCTLPEVFSQVRKGERIWFDDGKIGGIVREAGADEVLLKSQLVEGLLERLSTLRPVS